MKASCGVAEAVLEGVVVILLESVKFELVLFSFILCLSDYAIQLSKIIFCPFPLKSVSSSIIVL